MRASLARPCSGTALSGRTAISAIAAIGAAYLVEPGVRAYTHELVVTLAGERWVP